MRKKLIFGYRGTTRTETQVKGDGGFVPKYLLDNHPKLGEPTGFEGFIKCTNKTNGKLGCNCQGFNEAALFTRARVKLVNILTNSPMDLHEHVMFNNKGFLSSASVRNDVYFGYCFQIWSEFEYDSRLADAVLPNITIKRHILVKNYRLLMNATRLANATLIATLSSLQGAELTFISPVQFRYLKYIGKKTEYQPFAPASEYSVYLPTRLKGDV